MPTFTQINMRTLRNIHPGEVLKEEFLEPMEISVYRLSKETGLSQTRISQIIKGKRSVTAETALKLGKFFGVPAEFWMNLQMENIESRIFLIRGQKVMIDRDLAELYGLETKHLNRQVKRNIQRFPGEFMFQLNVEERNQLVSICHRFKTMKHSRKKQNRLHCQGAHCAV